MIYEYKNTNSLNLKHYFENEWLESNGLGGYSSSSLCLCNTRKYHGLFVANLAKPEGRHVLLSTIDESIIVNNEELFFSCRQHPGGFFPAGFNSLKNVRIASWPSFFYTLNSNPGNPLSSVDISRDLLMLPGKNLLLVRYELKQNKIKNTPSKVLLRLKPLLAFRHFHALTSANKFLNSNINNVPGGFSIQPYSALPTLYMQVEGQMEEQVEFYNLPDWYFNVDYQVEQSRGFPYQEDLFMPGLFEINLQPDKPVFLAVGLKTFAEQYNKRKETMKNVWALETTRRLDDEQNNLGLPGCLQAHLARQGRKFIVEQPSLNDAKQKSILAGYHWFGAWGRDTLISLPGLTFYANQPEAGIEILRHIGSTSKNGLLPNCFVLNGQSHAYNSVDASLWYAWAVQEMLKACPETKSMVKEICWPILKQTIKSYSKGEAPHVYQDEAGFLNVGNANTQLTWMDAQVNGNPVTPRNGFAVEINALWYNLLAFAANLAMQFDEPVPFNQINLNAMRSEFFNRFWVADGAGGYLADVWQEEYIDCRLRPNQLFALALPYPILEEIHHSSVIKRVKGELLTPFGLRTLSPLSQDYQPTYAGNPCARDRAYHQGTVWPWLLGAYAQALLKNTQNADADVAELLATLTPLFKIHLAEAGVGSISEIFSPEPPYKPNGCIAQAWSVAEVLRLLHIAQKAAPDVYALWEESIV